MTHFRPLKTFWEAYAELPAHIKRKVRQMFELFQQGAEHPPFHPSLRIRKMRGYPNIWEGHITMQIVFTSHIEHDPESGETIYVFRNIGTHEATDGHSFPYPAVHCQPSSADPNRPTLRPAARYE